jgi:hypothetical protein
VYYNILRIPSIVSIARVHTLFNNIHFSCSFFFSLSCFLFNCIMDKSVKEESSRLNKPPVYLHNPRPQLKRPLDAGPFPSHHPLAGLPLPAHPTPYQQQQAARLQYYHTRPAAYVENPSFGLNDFELQDTLGR